PSWLFPAPQPPTDGSTIKKSPSLSGCLPPMITVQTDIRCPAVSLSGRYGASDFQISSLPYNIDSQYIEVGAGLEVFTTEPFSAITVNGLKAPSLISCAGLVIARKIVLTDDTNPVYELLI